ncbi:MAG: hypothetical protein OXR73_28135 [Myxococcales bacterium]|nr:hypothetical protein [Myxococcales bacterium]
MSQARTTVAAVWSVLVVVGCGGSSQHGTACPDKAQCEATARREARDRPGDGGMASDAAFRASAPRPAAPPGPGRDGAPVSSRGTSSEPGRSGMAPDAGRGELDAGAARPPPSDPRHVLDVCGQRVQLPDDYAEPGNELIIDMHVLFLPPFGATLGGWDPHAPVLEPYDLPWLSWGGCPSMCVDRVFLREFVLGGETALAINAGLAHSLVDRGEFAAPDTLISNPDLWGNVQFINDQMGEGEARLLFAPAIMPNDRPERQLDEMRHWAETSVVTAWLLDTGWPQPLPADSQRPKGYWLDDPEGRAAVERGIELGIPRFLVRKGMPQTWHDPQYTSPRDVGPVARAYPDANFVVLQAAFEHGLGLGETSQSDPDDPGADVGWGPGVGTWPEGPYDPDDPEVQVDYPLDRGVNSLITSLRKAGVAPGENVYASVDGAWAMLLQRPMEAAHLLGKLLVYVGEDNVLWGSQSTFTGDPAVLIKAFREFQIPAELRVRYGYPELTPHRRAKILGLNAARLLCILPERWPKAP